MELGTRKQQLCAWALAGVLAATGCSGDSTDVDDESPDDHTPPATVTDLRVLMPTPATLTLRWTAPGDDGNQGYAMAYDLRISLAAITEENFADAYAIGLDGNPLPPGTTEEVLIDSLDPGRTYRFALKTRDEAGNSSGISNCPEGTCLQECAVAIPDTNLLRILREQLDVPTGDLMLSDLLRLEELWGFECGIADLTGLEAAQYLRMANLQGNAITDLSPLGQIGGLEALNVTGNLLTDLSPLGGLTGLLELGCGQNQIADLSVLAGMTGLTLLAIHSNPLTDLSPLAGLDHLTTINVGNLGLEDLDMLAGKTTLRIVVANGNRLADIDALASLPDLTEVNLLFNQVTDLAALVANADFGSGDSLDVRYNPLSQTALDVQIPALVARGATVQY